MESQLLIKKTPKYIISITYALIALSIFSCCSRPDYNVIIGFLILLLRSHDASDRKQFFTKAALQIILLSCIIDIFWIVKYTGLWRHGDDTTDLWKSLTFIHNTTYYFGFLEFILKLPLIYFYYKQFRFSNSSIGDLFNIKYSTQSLFR